MNSFFSVEVYFKILFLNRIFSIFKYSLSTEINTLNQYISCFLFTEKTRTSPYLEKGEIKNKTVVVGRNATIPCYELISGTLPDFRWLRWKGRQDPVVLNIIASGTSEFNKSVVEVVKAARYKQVSKKSHRSNDQAPLYGVELVFTNITKQDEGFYTCLVTNHIGHDFKTMYLTVRESSEFYIKIPIYLVIAK